MANQNLRSFLVADIANRRLYLATTIDKRNVNRLARELNADQLRQELTARSADLGRFVRRLSPTQAAAFSAPTSLPPGESILVKELLRAEIDTFQTGHSRTNNRSKTHY